MLCSRESTTLNLPGLQARLDGENPKPAAELKKDHENYEPEQDKRDRLPVPKSGCRSPDQPPQGMDTRKKFLEVPGLFSVKVNLPCASAMLVPIACH
jgi:hypothetical protein